MQKTIIVEPHGGLANRMRVIASSIWLGSLTNRKLKLIWNVNSGLNCPIEELFMPIKDVDVINKHIVYRLLVFNQPRDSFKHKILGLVKKLITKQYFLIQDADIQRVHKDKNELCALVNSKKDIFMHTCEEISHKTHEYKRLFIPITEIQHKIDEYCKGFNNKTIGLHIRRTDNKISIINSPIELFIKRIQEDLEKDSGCNYYLSTDDPDTESQLKTLFGPNIITRPKDYSRFSKTGVKDAVVDLFCLSNTSKIYGSYWSSFSEIASRINGIQIEKLKLS